MHSAQEPGSTQFTINMRHNFFSTPSSPHWKVITCIKWVITERDVA